MPSERPRIVIVHGDPATMLALKRQLDGAGAKAVGTRSVEKAMDRIAFSSRVDGILIPWSLPAHGAIELVWQLEKSGVRAPFLLTFAARWTRDDAARALQLGYDAFFGSPVNPGGVLQELAELKRTGQSATRQRILDMGGPALLEPNPLLWSVTDDPEWRERMLELAARASSRVLARTDRVGRVLRGLDLVAGHPVEATLVSAIREVLLEGWEALAAAARRAVLGETRLARLVRTALTAIAPESRAADIGRLPRDTDTVMREVVVRAEARRGRELSAAFQGLCGHASNLLIGTDPTVFINELAVALKLTPAQLEMVPPDRLRSAAAHLIGSAHEHEALAHVRLALLADVLRRSRYGVDPEAVETLGQLLESDDPYDDGLGAQLVAAASSFQDDEALEVLRGTPLPTIEGALGDLVTTSPELRWQVEQLESRLQMVVEATQASGAVDQRRVADLLDVYERGGAETVPSGTIHALMHATELATDRRNSEVHSLFGALSLDTPQKVGAFQTFLQSHHDQPIHSDLLLEAGRAAERPDDLANIHRQLMESDPPSHVEWATALAHLDRAATDLGLDPPVKVSDPDVRSVLGAPSPWDLAADLVLAWEEDPARRQAAQVKRDARQSEPGPSESNYWAQRMSVARRTGESLETTADAPKTPPPSEPVDHQGVLNMIRTGALDEALVAIRRLSDTHPRTVALLSRLGAALQKANRLQAAAELYERALEIQPNRLPVRLDLARLKLDLGDPEGAQPLLVQIRESAPGFGDSEALWARLQESQST